MRAVIVSGLVAALPIAAAAPAWIPYASNASVPELHGLPVSASRGNFYLNGSTSAVCPDYDPHCPSENTTIISGPVFGNDWQGNPSNATHWYMGILEPNGQKVYQNGLDPGIGGLALTYTAAESGNYIGAARQDGGEMIIQYSNGTNSTAMFIALSVTGKILGWSACQDATGSWKIYTGPPVGDAPNDGCVIVEILLKETHAAAPQFYYCDGCQYRCNNIYAYCVEATCWPPYCGTYEASTTE